MTFQDINVSHAIWGKNIVALKGKTSRNKPIHTAGELVKITKELIKIQKYAFITADILFVNGIPFLYLQFARLSSRRREI